MKGFCTFPFFAQSLPGSALHPQGNHTSVGRCSHSLFLPNPWFRPPGGIAFFQKSDFMRLFLPPCVCPYPLPPLVLLISFLLYCPCPSSAWFNSPPRREPLFFKPSFAPLSVCTYLCHTQPRIFYTWLDGRRPKGLLKSDPH